LHLPHSPRNISRLLPTQALLEDTPIDLSVYECQACGFIQLAQILDVSFYEDYLMTVSHSAQMRAFQAAQATDFVKRFGLANKRVIEIGCGDGNYLEYLRDAGAEVAGIEPSAAFRQLTQQRDFKVFSGYIDRNNLVPDAPWHGFVTRQVLEHVADPNSFLQGIRASMTTEAVGLVEVPSLEQTLADRRFYDFFPDHLNYFSVRTLRHALERNGFEVIETVRGMNGEYNVALVQVSQNSGFADLQQAALRLETEIRSFIERHRSAGKRVAVWGSGGKGIAALAIAKTQDIAYVIDSDPYKQGLFTPVSHFLVVAPEHLKRDPVDAIIITALAYRDEIIEQLRQTIGFQGEIVILGYDLEAAKE